MRQFFLQQFTGFDQLRAARAFADTERVGNFFVTKALDDVEVEYYAVAFGQLRDFFEQFFLGEVADGFGIYGAVVVVGQSDIFFLEGTFVVIFQGGIDRDTPNPSLERAFPLKLFEVIEDFDKCILK